MYLCAGRDGYVPLFEPNAERPQFGCLENSQRLKYRLLLLVCVSFLSILWFKIFLSNRIWYSLHKQDREDPYGSDKDVQGLSLDAKFASQVDQLRTGMAHLPNMDGFVFSVDPLFQLEPGIRWFLQVNTIVIAKITMRKENKTIIDDKRNLAKGGVWPSLINITFSLTPFQHPDLSLALRFALNLI